MTSGYGVCGPNLRETTLLHDIIEPIDDHQFILHGRHGDVINIAGKRASLEDLNALLSNIDGVSDGAIVVPDFDDDGVARLVALVVAPTLRRGRIRKALADNIDPVFLPRHIYKVTKLPRNDTGKLPRSALLELLWKAKQQP